MATILRTERLTLRPPHEGDIEPIFRACQDPDIQRFTLVPVPYTRQDAEHFVFVRAPSAGSVRRVITLSAGDDEPIGCIGVVLDEDTGSLGYWCAREHRGNGYMSEALSAVIDDALSADGLGLRRLTWSALPNNAASARTAAHAGFRYTGIGSEHAAGRHEQVFTAELTVADDRKPQHGPCWSTKTEWARRPRIRCPLGGVEVPTRQG
ncbi:putative acetyltransferase [Gordonia araii NBRC 100433]|uniref:Putative acetyltransferase n=1 Tax=Gordonia araii NBRC 100433 TaxID=1073574 RepID=G7GYR0_9ACTN|nr:GNAT family N-acetyltransferase [Gordonia araii]NNG98964.1 GNAT family N-acetyltransferase [Gordonia araii NBRC 100433]GAB08735.1 putative acetyltransferase [Gordonia araii NBRC 100433]